MDGAVNKTSGGALTVRKGFINSTISSRIENLADQNHRKGLLALQKDNYKDALKFYGEAILSRPQIAVLHFEKGIAHYNLGQHQEALEEFKKTAELEPDKAEAYNNIGAIYSENPELAVSAVDDFEKELQLLEDIDSLETTHLEKAVEMFNKAISLNPKYEKAYFNKGYILAELGKFDKAVETYEKLIAINPNNATYYFNAGTFLYDAWEKTRDKSQLEKALPYFSNALRTNPNYRNAFMDKACVLCDLGQPKEARIVLNELLKRFPGDADAQKMLERMDIRKI
jgi:tetratricopeptide (TPR) repeat protein